jgi:hypothetical protein
VNLEQIDKAHQTWIDSLVSSFEEQLTAILSAAKAKLQARLHGALKLDADGKLQRTAANSGVIRKLDGWFMAEMEASGLNHLVAEFTGQFPGQFQFFQQTLDYLSAAMKTALPKIDWSGTDRQVFASFAANTRDALAATVESTAAVARNRILLSVGGLKFSDLVVTLATALDRGVPAATSIAETATSTFYRVIANQGYQKLDAEFPGTVRYKFYGPLDKLNRPFCRHLLEAAKSYTREEIDAMDNGQIPNVFLSGGGWRCRHSWIGAIQQEAASGSVIHN